MGADNTARGARLAEAWRANWSYLVGLAFGMLGDIGAAEDAVQEAFARLASTEPDQVDDARGWLIVVTSRICLDQIRSARFQRDRPHDATAIESAGVAGAPALSVDPADRVTLDDQVRLALLVVLDRLTPAERVAFILHDVFQMPFTAIAETLGKSAATCRQVAKRARTKIQSQSPRPAVPAGTSQHRQVAEQFIKACAGGDLETLLGLLDPDIWGDVDLGPLDARTGQTRRGALQVATNFLRYFGGTTTLVSNPVAGPAVVLAFAGQRLTAVILLTIEGERIRKIHVIADPAKVGFLSSQLGTALSVLRREPVEVLADGYGGGFTVGTERGAAMRAWHVDRPGPVGVDGGDGGPLAERDTPVPEPGPGELLLRVRACGVCRTDLHVTEGDLPVHRPGVTPGHEVVGEVAATGPGDAAGFAVGDRAGAAWLRWTDGTCRFCARGSENLCPSSTYTGWDADGGYAEYLTVPAAYAHPLPRGYSDAELAPLLCAGIIGYRALKRAALPPGGRLGLYGFGGSAHLAAQVALAQGATLSVMTRGEKAQELARSLGASFVGGAADMPPEPLDAAILFAPVGDLVLPAMAALDRGGTLAIAGIYLTDIPPMPYDKYLFQERQLRSVTSNTRQDAREFLTFAAEHKLSVTTHEYPLDAADRALADLKAGRFDGAAVLIP